MPPTMYKKAMKAIQNTMETRDFPYEDIIGFFACFGKTFETPEEEAAFKKRYNPENKEYINPERALTALHEFIQKDEFVLMLQSEAKILDPKTKGFVHHADDFRWMLSQLGEDLSEDDMNDFIREALGRSEDLFDINVFIQHMCKSNTQVQDDSKNKKGKR